jgi:halimadienyl-diphosphate synthase
VDLKQDAQELVRNLNQRMGPSPYDIAWLARLRASTDAGPRWPGLIDWLLENQHPDGSWGSKIMYYHDRVICTLAAMIALRENGQDHQAQQSIRRAERFLWHHLHLLSRDPFELVGFELLVPTLLSQAQTLGLDVPNHTCCYGEILTAKLRLIPPEVLYSPHVSTVHSLEFLGQSADRERLRQALTSNGSLGNSPAATAYYLLLGLDDQRAMAYLEGMQRHTGNAVTVYPFRTFELAWVLNNLAFSGLPATDFAPPSIWEQLQLEMGENGVGVDPTFGIPDGDTTSVCCQLLLSAGYRVNPRVLARYENKETHIFRTYEYERNVSVSTNIHALEALGLMADYPERGQVREQIAIMLLDSRKYKMYWADKWHTSPYYATAHALVGLLKEGSHLPSACRQTIDWLVHTQRNDGSWGFFECGTAEETAYTLTALLHYHRHDPVDPDVLHRGAAYLMSTYPAEDSSYPALWIEKCLYIPHDIVRAAILAALILYVETFGRSP